MTRMLMRKEAISSSAIEGINCTLDELLLPKNGIAGRSAPRMRSTLTHHFDGFNGLPEATPS